MDFVILAAGRGTRMKSRLPKVLHPIAGRPLVYFPIRAALQAGATKVILVCSVEHRDLLQTQVDALFAPHTVVCCVQQKPLGTGDAARAGIEHCTTETVGIMCGDTPLVTAALIRELTEYQTAQSAVLAVQSCCVADPQGYGRIIRDATGRAVAIREHRDLRNDAERGISEVNAGIYIGKRDLIAASLRRLEPMNDQGEYYLTDIVADLARSALVVAKPGSADSLVGVNDRVQLVAAETAVFEQIARGHALAGVTVCPGARIDDTVQMGPDTTVEAGVRLRGNTRIGSGNFIDVGCVIADSTIGDDNAIKPHSVIDKSVVGNRTQIGPFAHLRPQSTIEDEAHIGNFVETKKTVVRRGAKANHLAYLGDGDVGEKANVGAGTIFCNYDGYQKHKTTIGPGAFIGSDSQIVAPVTIGAGAYVATGTTVTQDVPDDGLAISRVKQENKLGYASRIKRRLAAAAGKKP